MSFLTASVTVLAQSKKIDSILNVRHPLRIDTILNPVEKVINKPDSVTQRAQNVLNKESNLNQVFPIKNSTVLTDSTKRELKKYNSEMGSLERKLNHKIDSLNKLKLPTKYYTKLKDSLMKAGPIKNLRNTQAYVNDLQEKINSPVKSVNSKLLGEGGKLNSKFNELNKEGIGLPTGLSTPTLSSMPTLTLAGTVPAIGSPSSPSLGLRNPLQISNPLNQETTALTKSIQDVSKLPQKEISHLANSAGLGGIGNEIKKEGQISSKAKTYLTEAKGITQGDVSQAKTLSRDLESKAENLGQIKELRASDKQLGQYKQMMGKMGTPDELEKMASNQLKKEAVSHFAGKEQILQGAIEELSKYRLKYPSATEVSKVFKGVRNEMSGKTFRERFVLGFNLQFQSTGDFKVDINPFLGYRISGRWTAGIGWVDRMQFHKYNIIVPEGRVFGPRFYTDVKWEKGFAARVEAENINMLVPGIQTEDSRQWSWNVMAGVKKDYRFTKKIKGNIQALYNVGHYIKNNNSYGDRLMVRMGFEFFNRSKE